MSGDAVGAERSEAGGLGATEADRRHRPIPEAQKLRVRDERVRALAALNGRGILEQILRDYWPESKDLRYPEYERALKQLELVAPPGRTRFRRHFEQAPVCPRCGHTQFACRSSQAQIWQCVHCRERLYLKAESLSHQGIPLEAREVEASVSNFRRRNVGPQSALPLVVCQVGRCLYNDWNDAAQEGRCQASQIVVLGDRQCITFLPDPARDPESAAVMRELLSRSQTEQDRKEQDG